MKITRIYAENYKTYKRLDLDLNVMEDRPIILIGGGNGCGKTTLFDAIYHALYGLEISTQRDFEKYLNAGVKNKEGLDNKQIVLEISFSGTVLNSETPYRLKRVYQLFDGKVRWSVELNMNGTPYTYGVSTPAQQRSSMEEIVNKIIAANLPSELSNYFLFDAMKTSELVKEEQISKLIMKNINSVMGFNKYAKLKEASETLLSEKKAARLDNEKQRQEFEKLNHTRQSKETELKKMREEFDKALEYSNENKDRYELSKQGRNTDEMTRERIRKQEELIRQIEQKSSDYRQGVDMVMKDLEKNVLFPTLAAKIRPEVEQIVNERKKIAEEQGERVSDEKLTQLTREIIQLLVEKYAEVGGADVEEIVRKMQMKGKHGDALNNKHPYLDNDDVEILESLIESPYTNLFLSYDNDRESLNIDIDELPQKKSQLEGLKKELTGVDYNIIKSYEENERTLKSLREGIKNIEQEIARLDEQISKFDYDIPQVPDPQYDMLCKLPEFFKGVANRLLAAKRKNIEQMMKVQLNQNLVVYSGVIGRVDLSSNGNEEISFKLYHKDGNEIFLSQLNAGAKQTVMQVLLKVLYELGDYNPPVMIDTVMGVLDKESREVILEYYFPDLAHQTILLSTDTEITTERDLEKIEAYVAKAYTLHRDKEAQCTTITEDYFGYTLRD